METELAFLQKLALGSFFCKTCFRTVAAGINGRNPSGYPTPRRPNAMAHCSNCTPDAGDKETGTWQVLSMATHVRSHKLGLLQK
jgi:hypothetical protein